MADFLTRVPYRELANSLLETNLRHAALFAGVAFERMVRRRAPRDRQENWHQYDLSTLINQLCQKGFIDEGTRREWHTARCVRNKAVHQDVLLTRPEVEHLLDVLHARKS